MPITPSMGLTIPTVLVTPGPTWAYQNNGAFDLIDAHDHSPTKGVPITPSGLNINSDLTMNGHNLIQIRSTQFDNLSGTLTTPDLSCVYVSAGDLWYTNAGGTPVQLTIGNSIASSTIGVVAKQFENVQINANTTILPGDTFSYLEVLTAAGAFTIDLPAANSVAAGRFYEVKDIDGMANVNPITITPNGTDTIDTHTGNFVMSTINASQRFVTDGSSKWFAQGFVSASEGAAVDTVFVADSAGNYQLKATGVTITATNDVNGVDVLTLNDVVFGTAGPYLEALSGSDKTINILDGSSNQDRPIVVSAKPSVEGLMIVRGRVFGTTGNVAKGEGFSSVRNSAGNYTITFTDAFANNNVTATATFSGVLFRDVQTDNEGSASFNVYTSVAGVLTDGDFNFQALGPRGA